jgi:hypothetical protein
MPIEKTLSARCAQATLRTINANPPESQSGHEVFRQRGWRLASIMTDGTPACRTSHALCEGLRLKPDALEIMLTA